MNKLIIAAAAVFALSASAFAGANYDVKAGGTNVDPTKNLVGYNSSNGTGNGAVVGGNGTSYDNSGVDFTDGPGTRSAQIQHDLGHAGNHGANANGGVGHGHD